jgi:glycine cleavage system pyridoxal-binding protein P
VAGEDQTGFSPDDRNIFKLYNEKVKRIVKQQQRETEKAIIGYGEYRLHTPCYIRRKVVQNVTGSTTEMDSKIQC